MDPGQRRALLWVWLGRESDADDGNEEYSQAKDEIQIDHFRACFEREPFSPGNDEIGLRAGVHVPLLLCHARNVWVHMEYEERHLFKSRPGNSPYFPQATIHLREYVRQHHSMPVGYNAYKKRNGPRVPEPQESS